MAMPWGARRGPIYHVCCCGPTSTAPNSEHMSFRSRWSMPNDRLPKYSLRASAKLRVQRYIMSKL